MSEHFNGKIYVYTNIKKLKQEGVIKQYIGQTVRTTNERAGKDGVRYTKNKTIHNKFSNAIKKWGWDSFECKVIIDGIENQEDMNKLEKLCIAIFDTYENGYNTTKGGDGSLGNRNGGMRGKKFTEEHKRKLSEAKKGVSSHMKGKTHSEETKAKIREARKKQVGENHPMYGKKMSEERRHRMSEIGKEVQNRPDMKERNRLKALGNNYATTTPVVCIELDMTFKSIEEAKRYMKDNYGINCLNISYVCCGKRQTCGEIIIDGEKRRLHWQYYKHAERLSEKALV